MPCVADASAEHLMPFSVEAIEPGSLVHTDGWIGYLPLEWRGCHHRITFLKAPKKSRRSCGHTALALLLAGRRDDPS